MTVGLLHNLAADDGASARPPQPLVHLLGFPRVSVGSRMTALSESGTRLLAFLALNRGASDRRYVAGRIWPDADDARAAGNLRTAVWRVNAGGTALVDACKASLRLNPDVLVDACLLGDWAARVISGTARPRDLAYVPWDLDQLDLLPGWYDDWLLLERERLRQRLLHALEALARELNRRERCGEAVEVSLLAVGMDPLRESALRVLIESHLAEGNRAEAVRRFEEHRALVRRELGIEPSGRLRALVTES